MNFPQAENAASTGFNIRRQVWISTVARRNNRYEWNLSDELLRQCRDAKKRGPIDREYQPTETDRSATDWETVGRVQDERVAV